MSVVAGVDPSLSSTGVAILDRETLQVRLFRSKSEDSLVAQLLRLRRLCHGIGAAVREAQPVLIVVEAPAYSKADKGTHELAGFWWRLADTLSQIAPLALVWPGTLKKFATGDGSTRHGRGKQPVIRAARWAFPDTLIRNDDEADAAVLAAMGACWLGDPFGRFPGRGVEAVNSVRWPRVREGAQV